MGKEEERKEDIVALDDVLAKATDESGEGQVEFVPGLGKMRFKKLTPTLGATLEKRATIGFDDKGRAKLDNKELSVLMVNACLMDPKIPEDKLRQFGMGFLNELVLAINRVSGIRTGKEGEEALQDF